MTITIAPSPAVSPRVQLTAQQRACLEQIARRQTRPQRLVRRAKMLLALATGVPPCHVMRQMHLHRGTVQREVAEEVRQRGRMETISTRRVGGCVQSGGGAAPSGRVLAQRHAG